MFLNLQYFYQICWIFEPQEIFLEIGQKEAGTKVLTFSDYDAIHHTAKCNCYRQTCASNLQFVDLNCLWRFNCCFVVNTWWIFAHKNTGQSKELLYTLIGLNIQSHQILWNFVRMSNSAFNILPIFDDSVYIDFHPVFTPGLFDRHLGSWDTFTHGSSCIPLFGHGMIFSGAGPLHQWCWRHPRWS